MGFFAEGWTGSFGTLRDVLEHRGIFAGFEGNAVWRLCSVSLGLGQNVNTIIVVEQT